MHAFKILPDEYIYSQEIDLSRNLKLALLLNLVGIASFVFFGWFFLYFSVILRKLIPISIGTTSLLPSTLNTILLIVAAFFITLTLHEAVHGLFFFIVTHDRPKFGLRGAFAYAAAPGWYIRRNPYLVVGLSPFVLISLSGLFATVFIPNSFLLPLLFGLTINASGAVGDLYVTGWLLGQPKEALINDRGDAMTVYCHQDSIVRIRRSD